MTLQTVDKNGKVPIGIYTYSNVTFQNTVKLLDFPGSTVLRILKLQSTYLVVVAYIYQTTYYIIGERICLLYGIG